ncbi:hypothetical protein GCM10023166_14420 [Paeniglutamicibacter cryotolerans]
MAPEPRQPAYCPGTHPSFDAGSHYTSTRYTEALTIEGLEPSIGNVGDSPGQRAGGPPHPATIRGFLHKIDIPPQRG